MMQTLLQLSAVLVLVLINGIFVAAEFALVSVRPTRIDQLADEGNRVALIVKRAMADPNRFISAAQVGITMASLGLGWIAEPALATIFIPLFEPTLGEGGRISAHLLAGVIAYLIITLLHIVVGEQVPKMIALQRSEATIMATALPVTWISVPFRPMIALLYWLTSITLKPLGLKRQGENHLVYSEDELKMLVIASRDQGYLDQSEQEMIHRIFGFHEIFTDQVMVPRTEINALQADSTLDEVTKAVSESGHARFPVYVENLDDILGVFHAKDLYQLLARGQQDRFDLRRMLRTPVMASSEMPLDDLLTEMKRRRTHIAIVVDEYGGTAGMVTLEDVVERIVGDVHDEFEDQSNEVEVLENGQVNVSGLLSLTEFNERFELGIEDPMYNTIGGFVFGQLGRRPEVGDEVPVNGHILRIDELDALRIDRLVLRPAATHDSDSQSESDDDASADNEPIRSGASTSSTPDQSTN